MGPWSPASSSRWIGRTKQARRSAPVQGPPATPNVPGPDRGAAGVGITIGSIIALLISQVPDSDPLRPLYVTLDPAIGVGISYHWSQFKATALQAWEDEREYADILAAQYALRQKLTQGTLSPEATERAQAELDLLQKDEEDLILRKVRRRRQSRAGRR